MITEASEVQSPIARAGRLCADFYWPFATDPSQHTEGTEPPLVMMAEGFLGGRQRSGPSMSALFRPGVAASVVVFGWAALVPFLAMVGDVWVFLPHKRIEFIRVTLRQRIVGIRLGVPAVAWIATMIAGFVVASGIMAIAHNSTNFEMVARLLKVATTAVAATWFFANWRLLNAVRHQGDALFRSIVRCDYGFPTKTLLIEGSSDGSREEQLENISQLLARAGEFTLASWGRVNVNRGGSGPLSPLLGSGGSGRSRLRTFALIALVLSGLGMAAKAAVAAVEGGLSRQLLRSLPGWLSMRSVRPRARSADVDMEQLPTPPGLDEPE